MRIRSDRGSPRRGAVTAAVTLAGCGAGQITQTDTQRRAVDGANVQLGTSRSATRSSRSATRPRARHVYPRGGTLRLSMTIVNPAPRPTGCVSATSPVAASVQVAGQPTSPRGETSLVEGGSARQPPGAAAAAPPRQPLAARQPPSRARAPATPGAPAAPPLPAHRRTPARPLRRRPRPHRLVASPATPQARRHSRGEIVLTGLREDIRPA